MLNSFGSLANKPGRALKQAALSGFMAVQNLTRGPKNLPVKAKKPLGLTSPWNKSATEKKHIPSVEPPSNHHVRFSRRAQLSPRVDDDSKMRLDTPDRLTWGFSKASRDPPSTHPSRKGGEPPAEMGVSAHHVSPFYTQQLAGLKRAYTVARNLGIPPTVFPDPPESPTTPNFITQSHTLLTNALNTLRGRSHEPVGYQHYLKQELHGYAEQTLKTSQSFDVRVPREALMKAYTAQLISWEELQTLAGDAKIDPRKQLFSTLGITRRLESGEWNTSTGYPTFRSLFSDMDIIAATKHHYQELLDTLAQQGYRVEAQGSQPGHTLFHTVPELDLALWPPNSMMPVRRLHEEVTNSPAEADLIKQFPMFQAMGELAKLKLLSKDDLEKFSDSELFHYFRNNVAKPLYKFFAAVDEVDALDQRHWIPARPNVHPPAELIKSYKRMVANQISPFEALNVQPDLAYTGNSWQYNRSQMIEAILKHQKEVASYIYPYFHPMVENTTIAGYRAASPRLLAHPFKALSESLASESPDLVPHQQELGKMLTAYEQALHRGHQNVLTSIHRHQFLEMEDLKAELVKHFMGHGQTLIDQMNGNLQLKRVLKAIHSGTPLRVEHKKALSQFIDQEKTRLTDAISDARQFMNNPDQKPSSEVLEQLRYITKFFEPTRAIDIKTWNGALNRLIGMEKLYNRINDVYVFRETPLIDGGEGVNFKRAHEVFTELQTAPTVDGTSHAITNLPKPPVGVPDYATERASYRDLYEGLYQQLAQDQPSFFTDWGLEHPRVTPHPMLEEMTRSVQGALQLPTLRSTRRLSNEHVDPALQQEVLRRHLNTALQQEALQVWMNTPYEDPDLHEAQTQITRSVNTLRQAADSGKLTPDLWKHEWQTLIRQLNHLNHTDSTIRAVEMMTLAHPGRIYQAAQAALRKNGVQEGTDAFNKHLAQLTSMFRASALAHLSDPKLLKPREVRQILSELDAVLKSNPDPEVQQAAKNLIDQVVTGPISWTASPFNFYRTAPDGFGLTLHADLLQRTHPASH
jgi:hypothetical protein